MLKFNICKRPPDLERSCGFIRKTGNAIATHSHFTFHISRSTFYVSRVLPHKSHGKVQKKSRQFPLLSKNVVYLQCGNVVKRALLFRVYHVYILKNQQNETIYNGPACMHTFALRL